MKIQDRYFLFASSALSVVSVGLLLLFKAITEADTLASWIVIMTGCIPLCYNVYKNILWNSRARRFKHHFGIKPPDVPDGDWKQMSAIQPIVDECLNAQAYVLQRVFEDENIILRNRPENLEQALERAKKIATKATLVEIEKKIFWAERNLAFEWGFEVWDSHGDYVSALDRAGKDKIKKKF